MTHQGGSPSPSPKQHSVLVILTPSHFQHLPSLSFILSYYPVTTLTCAWTDFFISWADLFSSCLQPATPAIFPQGKYDFSIPCPTLQELLMPTRSSPSSSAQHANLLLHYAAHLHSPPGPSSRVCQIYSRLMTRSLSELFASLLILFLCLKGPSLTSWSRCTYLLPNGKLSVPLHPLPSSGKFGHLLCKLS